MDKKAAQVRYMKDRLETLSRTKRVYFGDSPVRLKKPAHVVEAEKIIAREQRIVDKFERQCIRATKRRDERRKAAYEAVRREILFGNPQKALRMLDKFERTEF